MARRAFEKDDILEEIRRCAFENGGVALGRARFETETGIRESDWSGRYWVRWGDALVEAGFSPNTLQGAFDDKELLRPLADLVRELGHFPVASELKIRRRQDSTFPSANTFARFGNKASLISRLADFCEEQTTYADVFEICARLIVPSKEPNSSVRAETVAADTGYVYLVKSGKHHKIGQTTDIGRRTYEIRLQLPEKAELVHYFSTDDPVGIERYWHERFASRRANGEWFLLSKADIAAFKSRRRFM